MVFAVYEQGMRIHTPKEQLLKRPGIRQTQAITASRRLVEDQDDAEHRQNLSDQQVSFQQQLQSFEKQGQAEPARAAVAAYKKMETHPESPIRHITAQQIMRTPVITYPAKGGLLEALALLRKEEIHYLVILDEQQALVGMLQDRDLLLEISGLGEIDLREQDLESLSAETLVRAPLVTASPETDIGDIARVMLAQKVRAMPITDAQGELVGLVTRSDLMLALANQTLEIWS
ncbi:HPP family protein [Marinospirillum sp.]|uniref:CBS domain-containing protein n=1 Tax=Marinospirillum sp. TaxID=2183934 RepID=UPI003A884F29